MASGWSPSTWRAQFVLHASERPSTDGRHFRDRAEQDVGRLSDIWGESEVLARQAEAERAARTKALVVTLGPSAYVELQPSRALEALAQEPGAEPDSSPLPADQEHLHVVLDEPMRLNLDPARNRPADRLTHGRH